MAEEEKKVVEKKEAVKLVEVATQHQPAFQLETGEVLTVEGILVKMANDLDEIKKSIVG